MYHYCCNSNCLEEIIMFLTYGEPPEDQKSILQKINKESNGTILINIFVVRSK